MAESSFTLGSILALAFGTVIFFTMCQYIMIYGGVYNPIANSTTPAGNYITKMFSATGYDAYFSSGVNGTVSHFSTAANQTVNATQPSSLAQTSGYAFIAGGFTTIYYTFSLFIPLTITLISNGTAYGPILKYLPFDIFAVIGTVVLGYVAALLTLKIISMVTKPAESIENI